MTNLNVVIGAFDYAVYPPTKMQRITTEAMRYQLSNMSGKAIMRGNLVSGASVLSINANAGSYILETITSDNVRQQAKIVVQ